jgi:hypothetical protein
VLIVSAAVFSLGLLSFEISQYLLAEQQLKANAGVAALACETTLAQSGDPGNSTNQSNAMNTALNLFQHNSILGNTLSGATLVTSGQLSSMSSGQATISFQFLDPLTHNAIQSPTSSTGTVVQATAVYGYSPSFSNLFDLVFQPIQMVTTAVSGVEELDLVVALDISGGMDDETPVTLVQRYWDYDINFPPHHIVYMEPALDGNALIPANGPLGQIFCFTAPLVNALAPQSLQDGADPTVTNCQQLFSGGLRGVANQSAPPGNYVLPYIGDNTAPGLTPTQGVALLNDLNKIAKCVTFLDSFRIGDTKAVAPYDLSTAGAQVNSDDPFVELHGWITIALLRDGGTEGQVLEAINAGNIDCQLIKSDCYWVGRYGFPYFNAAANVYVDGVIQIYSKQQPPLTNYGGGTGPTSSYSNYGFNFANGSAASSIGNNTTLGNVVTPTGTPGAYNSDYTPKVTWGPSSANTFSDAVVNLDGNSAFGGITYNGFSFPSVGALVEAARGNLESAATVQAAGVDQAALGVTPTTGYQAAYAQAAAAQIEPLMSVENALPGFFQEATQMGNTNIGFTAFNDAAGTTSTGTFSASNVSADYAAGGTANFPLPGIVLAAGNATTINTALPTLTVGGNRNVAQAIQAALSQLSTSSRAGAQKAIVLVTDGPPTVDLNDDPGSTQAQSYADARSQAVAAYKAGVPIYCVSIYQNATDQSDEATIYNDTNNDSTAGGIAAISGYGAKYYQLSYSTPSGTKAALTQIFGNIVRQLGSLMPM